MKQRCSAAFACLLLQLSPVAGMLSQSADDLPLLEAVIRHETGAFLHETKQSIKIVT